VSKYYSLNDYAFKRWSQRIIRLVIRVLHRRHLIVVVSVKSSPRVYTLPDCPHCDSLKGWLRERGIEFEERPFDTEIQLELIMRNVFGNPPVLEVGSRATPSEELFLDEALDEEKVMEALRAEKA